MLDDLALFTERKASDQVRFRHRPPLHAHHDRLAVDHVPVEAGLGMVPDRVGAVVGHVEVEEPVPVNVRQGQRHRAFAAIEHLPGRGKLSLAVIEKDVGPASDGIDDQVEIPIAVDVHQGRSGRVEVRTGHTGLGGHIFEFPVAQVAIEDVVVVQPAKVEVHQAVAVHVPGRHTAPVQINLVGQVAFRCEMIGEPNAGDGGGHRNKSGVPGRGHRQRGASISRTALPFGSPKQNAGKEEKAGKRRT